MNKKDKIITAVSITVGATASIGIANKIIKTIATVKNSLAKSEGNYFDWRFGKIYYKKAGNGKPILLIHNLKSTESSFEWHKVIGELSRTNTVYAIDLLGCGCSDKAKIIYTNYMYVQMVTDFIKKVIGTKTDVIVSGESSSIIFMACKNDTTIIDRIIAISPESLTKINRMPNARTKTLKKIIEIPVFGTFIYNICVSRKRISNHLTRSFYDCSKIDKKEIIARSEASHLGKAKYLYSSLKGRYTNTNILNNLSTIDNSIYMISGTHSCENKMIIDQYMDFNASIETFYIENCGSLPHIEEPEEFVKQVKVFFETI